MKEFNIQKAREGHPVCTRDGRKARIICFDRKHKEDKFPIVALVTLPDTETELVELYNTEGITYNYTRDYDLMMASVKHEGWVNIYRDGGWFGTSVKVYQTKEVAIKKALNDKTYIGTTK